MNQLKEDLIWIALGIPGMVLIGLVLHSLVHFETGVLVITSMILGTLLMVFATVMPVPCQIMVRTMFVLPVRRERTLFSSRLLKAVALANRAIRMSSIK